MCKNITIFAIIATLIGGIFLFYTSPHVKYMLEDVRENLGSCHNRYFPGTKKLLNVNGEQVFDKAYRAPTDILKGFPWLGQYLFGGPAQPYCQMNINPFYGSNVTWTEYIGTNADSFTESSILPIIGKLDDSEYVFFNRDGFIVIDKVGSEFYVRGFYGYQASL